MRNKEMIDFGEFSVPTVSESEIREACDKIAEYLPEKKQPVNTGFPVYRYGLIAACLVLVVVTAATVPKWHGFENRPQVTQDGGGKIEMQDSQKTVPDTEVTPKSAPKTEQDNPETKVMKKPDGALKPKAAAEQKIASAPAGTINKKEPNKDVPAAADTSKPAKTENKKTEKAESESQAAEDTARQEPVIMRSNDAAAETPSEASGNTTAGSDPETSTKNGDAAVSPAPEALMKSAAMGIQAAEPVRIITALTAGKHTGTVVLSNGKLCFDEIARDTGGVCASAPLTVLLQPQTELWTADKIISFFGTDPRPAWIPVDLKLTGSAEGAEVTVLDGGTRAEYIYDNGAARRLTVSAEKPKEPGTSNSVINGHNVSVSYEKGGSAPDYGTYTARFNLNGTDYAVTSENLTQEEFVKVLISYFD